MSIAPPPVLPEGVRQGNENLILLTDTAGVKLWELIERDRSGEFLRIAITGGGCNGLKYYIEPTDEPPLKTDEQIDLDGVNVIVCGKSLFYILGTEVTWKKDLMGERFDFINPNASGSCGCGETFNV